VYVDIQILLAQLSRTTKTSQVWKEEILTHNKGQTKRIIRHVFHKDSNVRLKRQILQSNHCKYAVGAGHGPQ
jgi:hypothetical protein